MTTARMPCVRARSANASRIRSRTALASRTTRRAVTRTGAVTTQLPLQRAVA